MPRTAPVAASVAALAVLLALGACKGGQKQQGAGNAQRQILPGSASDAMLPVDTVRSQAPLAPRSASTGKAEAAPEATDEAAPADGGPDAAAAPDKAAPGKTAPVKTAPVKTGADKPAAPPQ